jgi:ubiquinone/menaquinone biosynthesis C-methylase UbiE
VLEIGAGRGANFARLPDGVDWIGLEPSGRLARALAGRATRHRRPARVLSAAAEAIPLDDRSVDGVLATTVLCSVHDLQRALREVRRVLRPDGRFLFFEHVAADPGTSSAWLQRTVAPLTCRRAPGCRPDRRIGDAVAAAGFAAVELGWFRRPGPLTTFGPWIAGVAVA